MGVPTQSKGGPGAAESPGCVWYFMSGELWDHPQPLRDVGGGLLGFQYNLQMRLIMATKLRVPSPLHLWSIPLGDFLPP